MEPWAYNLSIFLLLALRCISLQSECKTEGRTDWMCSRCSVLALSVADGTALTQPHQNNPLQQNGCSTGNTVRCKARLNDWPPDTTWPTSCPAISEMNRHRSANRVNWDSAKTGPSKLDSSCQTYHAEVNRNSQTFRSWNNSFWDEGMKVTCISILNLATITNLCLYNIHEQQIHKIKFMTNIYLLHVVTPRCRNVLEIQVP